MEFTWSDKEDEELYKHGITVMWVSGRTKSIQNFVEKLSYKIGHKCDFSFSAGRAHIDVLKKGYEKAVEFINNNDFIKQFIVSYSEETYNNGTYFEILH